MTRDPIPSIPPCPACGMDNARRTPTDRSHLGRYECQECPTFFDGTTSEWERWSGHRARRQEARVGNATDT